MNKKLKKMMRNGVVTSLIVSLVVAVLVHYIDLKPEPEEPILQFVEVNRTCDVVECDFVETKFTYCRSSFITEYEAFHLKKINHHDVENLSSCFVQTNADYISCPQIEGRIRIFGESIIYNSYDNIGLVGTSSKVTGKINQTRCVNS